MAVPEAAESAKSGAVVAGDAEEEEPESVEETCIDHTVAGLAQTEVAIEAEGASGNTGVCRFAAAAAAGSTGAECTVAGPEARRIVDSTVVEEEGLGDGAVAAGSLDEN